MRTAVIIATCRRPAMLERLLRTLAAGPMPADVEIWVVENGPDSGAAAVCQAQTVGGRVRHLYRSLGNKALALNHAIGRCGADFVVFLDDDVTPAAGLVHTYVEAAGRLGPGHFFGGGLVADAEVACPPHLLPYLPRSASGWSFSEAEAEIPPAAFDFFFGANWAAFCSDLEACGLFRPELGISQSRYSSVGEETELQQRLLAAGGRPVYLPGAVILHPVPAECYTARWLWRRRFRLGVAEWRTVHGPDGRRGRRLVGLPLWAIRALAGLELRALGRSFGGADVPARIENRMEQAHLLGLLYGAWTDRAHFRRNPSWRPSDDRFGRRAGA